MSDLSWHDPVWLLGQWNPSSVMVSMWSEKPMFTLPSLSAVSPTSSLKQIQCYNSKFPEIHDLRNYPTLQVKVSNPSTKALTYNILLAGRDARDFTVPKGSSVTISARQTIPLSVEFTSRYLRPAEATLVLIGTRQGSNTGCTLTFKLRTQVDNITPTVSVECWSCSLWTLYIFTLVSYLVFLCQYSL